MSNDHRKGLLVLENDDGMDKEAMNFVGGLNRLMSSATNFTAGLIPGVGTKMVQAGGAQVAQQTAKNIGTAGNYLMAGGALAGAGAGALTAGEGNRVGGALQGAMIGLTPGLLLKGRAAALNKGLSAEASAVSKTGGPAAPTTANPTAS